MTAWTTEHVAQIRAQLERVVAGRVFANAGRMPGLLRHLLDSELSGAARRLNQTSIAIDVFDRDANFDPGVDSIVRVEMGRLRNKLREYYTSEGAGDPWSSRCPRGVTRLPWKCAPSPWRCALRDAKTGIAFLRNPKMRP